MSAIAIREICSGKNGLARAVSRKCAKFQGHSWISIAKRERIYDVNTNLQPQANSWELPRIDRPRNHPPVPSPRKSHANSQEVFTCGLVSFCRKCIVQALAVQSCRSFKWAGIGKFYVMDIHSVFPPYLNDTIVLAWLQFMFLHRAQIFACVSSCRLESLELSYAYIHAVCPMACFYSSFDCFWPVSCLDCWMYAWIVPGWLRIDMCTRRLFQAVFRYLWWPYKMGPDIRPSVRPSIHPSTSPSVNFSF